MDPSFGGSLSGLANSIASMTSLVLTVQEVLEDGVWILAQLPSLIHQQYICTSEEHLSIRSSSMDEVDYFQF
jgi:hypothetical protein